MIVGNCGIQPEYFLDEITYSECNSLLDAYNERYKDTWEQTRYISFVFAAAQNEKIKKPTDVLKFEWDKEEEQVKMTLEERRRREEEMLALVDSKKRL